MALNDIKVPKENAQGTFNEIALAPADIGAVASNDSRLTDARTPSSTLAHASSHHTGGADAISAFSIGADSLFDFGSQILAGTGVTLTASRARIWTLVSSSSTTVTLPTTGVELGDRIVLRGGTPVTATITITATAVSDTITASGQQISYLYSSTGIGNRWVKNSVDTHTHVAADITGLPAASTTTPAALGTAAVGTGTTFARADHVHAVPTAAEVGADPIFEQIITSTANFTVAAARRTRLLVSTSGSVSIALNTTNPQNGDFVEVSVVRNGAGAEAATITTGGFGTSVLRTGQIASFVYDSASGPPRWLIRQPGDFDVFRFRIAQSLGSANKVALNLDSVVGERTLTVPNRSGTIVVSDTSAGTGSDVINNIVSLTQAEYNAIGSPDSATLFLITDP